MSFFKNLQIYDTEYTKIRIGPKKDGGYVVLSENIKNCNVLYSYGINDDVSFELDFVRVNPNCIIRLFDHTINELPEKNPSFNFIKEGIASEKKVNLDTLENHLYRFNDNLKFNKILKMDIEWNEWDVFEKMPNEIMCQFDQILCEFHFIPVFYEQNHSEYFTKFHKLIYEQINQQLFEKYQKVLNKIFDKFYLFHLHINNSLPVNKILNNEFPPLVEMSLVNKKIINHPRFTLFKYPIENLDFPNKPYKSDIINFNWSIYK